MRTTIHLDDHLFAEIKKIAADTGKTPAAFIQGALRESLSRRRATEQPAPDLPLFHGTGVMSGVDLNDAASLLDLMQGDNGPA